MIPVGVFCVAAAILAVILFFPYSIPDHGSSVEIWVEPGMTPGEIAHRLHDHGVLRNESLFLLSAKIMRVSRRLQAGQYEFSGLQSNFIVLRALYRGLSILHQVTFPEGSRITRMARILHQTFQMDSARFVDLCGDKSMIRHVGIHAPGLEGYLYPDTYRFNFNITPEQVIGRMVSRFHEVFHDSLRSRADSMGMSVHQVITLASIVEGEAILDHERADIAALYLNRLNRRMLLQADPTIQYIIPDGPRRLLHKDLEIESPYNTYRHLGLPPGPVNNPGRASILAVLYPSSVNYLYMVANGDGSHTFSSNLEDHNRAKRRFNRIRRQISLQKKRSQSSNG